ncbi:hypothetical protein [Nocardia sp. NBC_01388]|uniref:hypothetical protein n=1 Tax=Nocardia sp. NBC_01388 TaxID=2903596 RepID=UPI00324665CA
MTSPDRSVPTGSFQLPTEGSNGLAGLTDGRSAAFSNDPNTVQNYTHQTFQAMTSGAVNSLAQRSSASLNNYVGGAIDEMLAGLCRALAGIDVLGVEPFAFLDGWASNLDAQAQQAVAGVGAISKGITGPITGTASSNPSDVLPAMTALQTRFQQILLQGNAIVFTTPQNYTPSKGILSIDIILIGAGGGGAGGMWNLAGAGRSAGGGGGGGGEVHTSIPASLLPTDGNGNFLPIAITVGPGGAAGAPGGQWGFPGAATSFGPWLAAGGGQGGGVAQGTSGPGGVAGTGMIPGGTGGHGGPAGIGDVYPSAGNGGNSISAYALYGGGGGGGGGAGFTGGQGGNGGQGGISPGGAAGSPGQTGTAPSSIVATGGGGGGGALTGSDSGGNGAFPAGGGGGGGGNATAAGYAGNGGAGIAYVIERTS